MENSLMRSSVSAPRTFNATKSGRRFGGFPASAPARPNSLQRRDNLGNVHRIPRRHEAYSALAEQLESFEGSRFAPHTSVQDGAARCSDGYLHASSQIHLRPGAMNLLKDQPDYMPSWDMIAQLVCQVNEDIACPICLYPPVLPRMERCGHIYCGPCAVQYIKYDNDGKSKKCAICSWVLRLEDLKRVSLNFVTPASVGACIELVLVKRASVGRGAGTVGIIKTELQAACQSGCKIHQYITETKAQNIRKTVREELDTLKAHKLVCIEQGDVEILPFVNILMEQLEDELRDEDEKWTSVSSLSMGTEGVDAESTPEAHSPIEPASTEVEVYFYQSSDGQPIYLDGLMWQCLLAEFGEVSLLPNPLVATISSIKSYRMTNTLQRRWRHLNHIPSGHAFILIEIELEELVSKDTLDHFKSSLNIRAAERDRRRLEDLRLTKLKQAAENRIVNLPEGFKLSGCADLSERTKPSFSASDFAPLCSSSVNSPQKSTSTISFAEVTKMGALSVIDRNRVATFGRPTQQNSAVFDLESEFWPSLSGPSTDGGPSTSSTPFRTSNRSSRRQLCVQSSNQKSVVEGESLPAPAPVRVKAKKHRKRHSNLDELLGSTVG
ncbi:unnamed protein product [Calicophoron daubneyi]|uniref:E3 ubiquitin-protein ligase RNF10 n=1 Tax=Calicophoron daubneyi TaxID=300641 RepID=A0AAV2T4X6_CALDB